MATYRIFEDSLNERFLAGRAKIQFFGGGFANGKTATACIRAIELARDYPGSNGLIARSTYPKLNDTIRKEFIKWCPDEWIKSFPRSTNASNTCTLTNGSTINFRYIQQQGKSNQESTTSNLLSATYDWIVVDQIEDPEIVHKDFLDLLGRLRGMTKYMGDDPTMPATGPRWFIITSNPTRNWVYKKLVKPVHNFWKAVKAGKKPVHNKDLLIEVDEDGNVVYDEDGLPIPIMEIYEGSTYENKQNLEADFIRTLETAYQGQMRDRFLLGKWAAYEGLVHPAFMEEVHVVQHQLMLNHIARMKMSMNLTVLEGYDYGLAVPFCYLLAFVDDKYNLYFVAGAYEKERAISHDDPTGEKLGHAELIKAAREEHGVSPENVILADPAIFRRGPQGKKVVGKTVSTMLMDEDIYTARGNSNIANGIAKVNQYLQPMEAHLNPITGTTYGSHIYISDELQFVIDEFNGYYWKSDNVGDRQDIPIDKDDHAMNTIKYML